MAGIQFKLDLNITDPLARLDHDPILPMRGALMLFDATHPYKPIAAGPPGNGSKLPNLAGAQAVETIGGGAALADVDPFFRISTATVPVDVRRTSRGGVYIEHSYAGAVWPVKIIDHLIANPSHALYVSYWYRTKPGAVPLALSVLERNGSNNSLLGVGYRLTPGGVNQGVTPNAVLSAAGFGAPDPAGFYCVSGAVSSTNLRGGTGADFDRYNGGPMFGTYGNNGPQGRASYRFYAEDLTVSGRSFDQVRAIDASLFAQLVSAPGGRYHGDTLPA